MSQHGGHKVHIPMEVGTGILIGGISKATQAEIEGLLDSIYVEELCSKVSIRISRGDAKQGMMREIDMADPRRRDDNPGNTLTLNINRHQYYTLG